MAQLVDAELVVLDTFSRAVSGDENDADTVRAFYRWTGLHLKAEGRAFVRIDHAGKDIEKGQRGTSAKNDDVDVVWQMVKADGGFKLTAKKRRMGWVPETLALLQYDTPHLHYKIADEVAPAGTESVVRHLDDLKVPPSVSARKAEQILREAGLGTRGILVRAAQKQRLRRVVSPAEIPVDNPVDNSGRTSGRTRPCSSGTHLGTHLEEMHSDQVGRTSGRGGTHPPTQVGRGASLSIGTHAAQRDPETAPADVDETSEVDF